MKKKPASKSAFFTPRVLISLAFCATGVLLTLLAFALYPGGNAFARQDQSSLQAPAPQNLQVPNSTFSHAQAPVSVQAAIVEDADLPAPGSAPLPPGAEAPNAIFVVNT